MSARKGIYRIVDVPCDGGESPNAYVPKITAEVRLHFPPNSVDRREVYSALYRAYEDAMTDAQVFFTERDDL